MAIGEVTMEESLYTLTALDIERAIRRIADSARRTTDDRLDDPV